MGAMVSPACHSATRSRCQNSLCPSMRRSLMGNLPDVSDLNAGVAEDLEAVGLHLHVTRVAVAIVSAPPEILDCLLGKAGIEYVGDGISPVVQVGVAAVNISGGIDD